jgi:DNA polymerase-3 subunit gamma/tau
LTNDESLLAAVVFVVVFVFVSCSGASIQRPIVNRQSSIVNPHCFPSMYQVLARKWRPQRFDDVVGQQAVTRTLRNAIASGRIHQAFVFAGPRGVGKTTTARLLARALNCVNGPTADPCGVCDACVEIAQGRDMDVLEIDAATHTGVDNIREVIISGLAIAPVRDRKRVFIIDEVHQLSSSSFNALLKSIEEPPPHVVFIMATTEADKIPDTILSRAQVFEFRTIGVSAIAAQLRMIADAEGLTVPDEALMDIARAAEGSMRDAESALDQVIAFAGTTITTDDVATVLGLVGRELLFAIMTAVADEDAAAAFQLAGRAVESGYDLKLVCRELSRLVRDLLLIAVDPSRLTDPELAPESERESLQAIGKRFSRDDLLRAFDVIARAETEIRASAQPRYHFEMALLRWIHLRKLVPIEDVIANLERGGGSGPLGAGGLGSGGRSAPTVGSGNRSASSPARPTFGSGNRPDFPRKPGGPQATLARIQEVRSTAAATAKAAAIETAVPDPVTEARELPADLRDRFLAELQRVKATFYGMVVSQAQTVECDGRRLLFTYGPANEHLRAQIEARRSELEAIAQQLAGSRVPIVTARGVAPSPEAPTDAAPLIPEAPAPGPDADLRTRALADEHVRALLEIFPAEITRVDEIS